jgi:hypothetical protein
MIRAGNVARLKDLGYDPARVFKRKPPSQYLHDTEFSFWTGEYEGWGRGKDGTRLFCTFRCGVYCAEACWNAGMPMKRD